MTVKAKTPQATQQVHDESKADIQPKSAPKTKGRKVVTAPAQNEAASGKQKKALPTNAEKPPKSAKPAKQKMVRDSFTLPENDYAKLTMLKAKCLENGIEVKKSELVRAGLTALAKMSVNTLIKAVGEVERLKTGRPKSN